MNVNILLRVSLKQLLGYPDRLPTAWVNYARQAWMEPIVIVDNTHDYVLMSRPEYERLNALDAPAN